MMIVIGYQIKGLVGNVADGQCSLALQTQLLSLPVIAELAINAN